MNVRFQPQFAALFISAFPKAWIQMSLSFPFVLKHGLLGNHFNETSCRLHPKWMGTIPVRQFLRNATEPWRCKLSNFISCCTCRLAWRPSLWFSTQLFRFFFACSCFGNLHKNEKYYKIYYIAKEKYYTKKNYYTQQKKKIQMVLQERTFKDLKSYKTVRKKLQYFFFFLVNLKTIYDTTWYDILYCPLGEICLNVLLHSPFKKEEKKTTETYIQNSVIHHSTVHITHE